MSFKKYLLDKTVQITVSIVGFIIAILMLNAFKVENDLKIAFTILFFLVATFNIIFDYFRCDKCGVKSSFGDSVSFGCCRCCYRNGNFSMYIVHFGITLSIPFRWKLSAPLQ